MAADRFHRIDGKVSVAQNFSGKAGDLYGIPVTFFQEAECIKCSGQHQLLQFFPVLQAVTVVNILGHVAHDCVGTAFQTVGERSVYHHAKVLRLVNNHMACLLYRLCLVDSLIQIGHRGQIIHVVCMIRE